MGSAPFPHKRGKSSVCFIAKTNGRFFYFSFFSKSLISVSSWMSAGGAAGAFGSSFFFLLRAFIPFTKRKMANAMMMKSSVVWIKITVIQRDGRRHLCPALHDCLFQCDFQVGEIHSADEQTYGRHDDVRYYRRNDFTEGTADNDTDRHVHHIAYAMANCLNSCKIFS